MSHGHAASTASEDAGLTTRQAADLLNVSHSFLIGLLETGEIEFRMMGACRRVPTGILMEYQRRDDARRRETADELTALTQDIGI